MTTAKNIRRLLLITAVALALAGRAAVPSEQSLLKVALDPQAGVVERTRAFADLRAVATDAAIPSLAKLLNDPAWAYPARSVLEAMPGPAAERALLDALGVVNRPLQIAGVIHSLGNRRHAAAIPAIAKLLASRDATVVRAALGALGNIGTARAAEALAAFQPTDELRPAWSEAALVAADAVPLAERAKSLELYRVILKNGSSVEKGAATIGLARVAPQPVGIVIEALQSPEAPIRQAALALIRSGEFGPELVTATGRIFVQLSADVQTQVLAVLFDRADRAAAPIARTALAAPEEAVRMAAARLLSVIGDSSDAPALLAMMSGAGEDARAARLALSRIAGPEINALLIERFRRADADRPAALAVLVSRGHRPLVDDLLQPEIYADPVFGRLAANALQTLGTGADLRRVLQLHRQLASEQRPVLTGVARRLAEKHGSLDEAAALVAVAARELPVAEATPLLVILAGIGGDTAMTTLSDRLKSPSSEARQAALLALGNWRDLRPVSRVLDIARSDAEAEVRAAAIQSATALLKRNAMGGDKAPAPQLVPAALEGFRQAWDLAEQPEARDAIVAALRGLKDTKATALAEMLEKEPRKN